FKLNKLPIYMTWHHSQQQDSGHQWLKSALMQVTATFRERN
ncbi:LysR family transcriptional regulator, partial [Vibrio vulnificus]